MRQYPQDCLAILSEQKEEKGESSDMVIREIYKDEFDGLMELYTQLHGNSIPERTCEVMELWNKIWQEKDHHIIVAEEDGKIVSSCVCVVIPNLTHGQRPYALVENVIVITDESYRGRGLATACLSSAPMCNPLFLCTSQSVGAFF